MAAFYTRDLVASSMKSKKSKVTILLNVTLPISLSNIHIYLLTLIPPFFNLDG